MVKIIISLLLPVICWAQSYPPTWTRNKTGKIIAIDSTKFVGIGTTNPQSILHIQGNQPTLTFTDGVNETFTFLWDSQNDGLTGTAPFNIPIHWSASRHVWDGGSLVYDATGLTNILGTALGSLSSISAASNLMLSEAYSTSGTKSGISNTIQGTASSGTSTLQGISSTVSQLATAGTPIVKGALIAVFTGTATGCNFAANGIIGLDITRTHLTSQAGTMTDNIGGRIASPSYISGSTKPATVIGWLINNQGISGATASYGIRIASQSGSTSNYGITVAGGFNGFGTETPTEMIDVTGNIKASGTVTGSNILTQSSGVYTPTIINVANLDGSTAYEFQYIRVGNNVTVSGRVDVNPTTTLTETKLGIPLPIASNLAAANECAGTSNCPDIAAQSAAILGDATNDRAQLEWQAGDVTNQPMYIMFMYQIK